MHAAGFWHEQSRHDRDDYVTIVWDNILEGLSYNFDKVGILHLICFYSYKDKILIKGRLS